MNAFLRGRDRAVFHFVNHGFQEANITFSLGMCCREVYRAPKYKRMKKFMLEATELFPFNLNGIKDQSTKHQHCVKLSCKKKNAT